MERLTGNFDHWLALARHSPTSLEAERQREIEKLIESAPEHLRPRLRGLQFRIDCCRRLHQTPLGACISITAMMRDSVQELRAALNGELFRGTDSPAAIIPFPQDHRA